MINNKPREYYNTVTDKDILIEVRERVERMEKAMLGDEAMGSKGLVDRYNETDRRSLENEKKISRMYWIASGVGAAGAFGFEVVRLLLG